MITIKNIKTFYNNYICFLKKINYFLNSNCLKHKSTLNIKKIKYCCFSYSKFNLIRITFKIIL